MNSGFIRLVFTDDAPQSLRISRALVLVFGMFNLSARETRIASVYTVIAMGIVILCKTIQDAFAPIEQMATEDELTGLMNRRFMLRVIQEHAQRHARRGTVFV